MSRLHVPRSWIRGQDLLLFRWGAPNISPRMKSAGCLMQGGVHRRSAYTGCKSATSGRGNPTILIIPYICEVTATRIPILRQPISAWRHPRQLICRPDSLFTSKGNWLIHHHQDHRQVTFRFLIARRKDSRLASAADCLKLHPGRWAR